MDLIVLIREAVAWQLSARELNAIWITDAYRRMSIRNRPTCIKASKRGLHTQVHSHHLWKLLRR